MQKLIALALFSILGLSWLAVDPTPVARAIHQVHHYDVARFDSQAYFEKALRGVEARDPYWMANLGMMYFFGQPEGVQQDKEQGRALIEAAMESGYPAGASLYLYFVDKSVEGARRAAQWGSYPAIERLAYAEAASWCGKGGLREGTMAAFLKNYETALTVDHALKFIPDELREKLRPDTEYELARLRKGILEGIPGNFDQLCSEPDWYDGLFPKG